jgi:hypothetical protein
MPVLAVAVAVEAGGGLVASQRPSGKFISPKAVIEK